MQILLIDWFEESLLMQLPANSFRFVPFHSRTDILPLLQDTDILILKSKTKIDKDFLEYSPRLKVVIRAGSGFEHIDVEALTERGIRLETTPQGNRDAVGEQAVGMLLCLMNHICRANQEVKRWIWKREENRGHELDGKTVGIIGYGNMGSAFARKLAGFGCKSLRMINTNRIMQTRFVKNQV